MAESQRTPQLPWLSDVSATKTLIEVIRLCQLIRCLPLWHGGSFITIAHDLLNLVSKTTAGVHFERNLSRHVLPFLQGLVPSEESFLSIDSLVNLDSIPSYLDMICRETCRLARDMKSHDRYLRYQVRAIGRVDISLARVSRIMSQVIPLELASKLRSPLYAVLDMKWDQQGPTLMRAFSDFYLQHYDWINGDLSLRESSKKLMIDREYVSHMTSVGWDESKVVSFMRLHVHISCNPFQSHDRYAIKQNHALRYFILKYIKDVEWDAERAMYRVRAGSEGNFIPRRNIASRIVSFVRGLPLFEETRTLDDDTVRRYFFLHFKDKVTWNGTAYELRGDNGLELPSSHQHLVRQMRSFMKDHIPVSLIGRHPIVYTNEEGEDLQWFFDHYAEKVTWRKHGYAVSYRSRNSVLLRSDAMKEVKGATEKVMNKHEAGCNNSSEGVGGTYQTTQWITLVNLFSVVHATLILLFGKPTLPSRFVTFDVGCGQEG